MDTATFCDHCGAALIATALSCHACGTSRTNASVRGAPITRKLSPDPLPTQPAVTLSTCTLVPKSLLAQRYRIIKVLGQGGFATVYQARDRAQHNRLVAIKQIHLETLDLQAMLDAADAYNREVNTLSRLRSKYFPRFHHHFMEEHHLYIVLEYIAGKTLEERLASQRRGYLSLAQVLNIGIALCEALQHLHMQQPPLIMRDVKPSNIILTRSGKLYLIDFGTAKHYRPGWKDTGPLGTPGYAAPEQYGKRAHTTPQTDIYGLGATLQTLLTGQEPLNVLQHGILPKRREHIPSRLLDELARMQAPNATRRPRNMAEVKQVLQEIKAQMPRERVKAGCAFVGDLLKQTSAFVYIVLFVLILVDLSASLDKTAQGLWLVSLLIMGAFTALRSIFVLRSAAQEKQARLSWGERITLVWKQLGLAQVVALAVSLLFYYILYMRSLIDMYDGYLYVGSILVLLGIIIGCGLVGGVWWLIAWLRHKRAERQYIQAQQAKQEIVIQQTIHKHP